MQGARRGTRSRDPGVTPCAEGGAKPLSHPGIPNTFLYLFILCGKKSAAPPTLSAHSLFFFQKFCSFAAHLPVFDPSGVQCARLWESEPALATWRTRVPAPFVKHPAVDRARDRTGRGCVCGRSESNSLTLNKMQNSAPQSGWTRPISKAPWSHVTGKQLEK